MSDRLIARPGDLLGPVLAELGLEAEVRGPGLAMVKDGDLTFEVRRRVERHFLMRIEVAEFVATMSLTGEPGRIELAHNGRRRRTGITARPRPGRPDLTRMARQLEADESLRTSFLPLDSKEVVIEVGASSLVRIRCIGFSRVAMAFPPTQRYVTAGHSQVDALRATLRTLAQLQ